MEKTNILKDKIEDAKNKIKILEQSLASYQNELDRFTEGQCKKMT